MARSQAPHRPNSSSACAAYFPRVLSLRLPSNSISCASSWSNFCQCKSQGKRSLEDLLYSNASPGLFSQDLRLINLVQTREHGASMRVNIRVIAYTFHTLCLLPHNIAFHNRLSAS